MRKIAFLLLMLVTAASARAEAKLRLWDVEADRAFWRAHPEPAYESVWYDPFADTVEEIERVQPDVFLWRLYNDDLHRAMDAGLTAELSESPAIAEAVSNMMPWVRDAVTDGEGRLMALPVSARPWPFTWYQDAWDAAGLTVDDVPRSYEELLDFLDAWAENPAPGVCASRLVRWNTGQEKYNYMYWLTELLLLSHEMQQRHAGEAVCFSTPEFIELAARARETGLALYEAEPRQSRRKGMPQLFQSDIRVGEHANNGLPYGLSHSVPLRLRRDQPTLTYLSMEAVCVRNGSPLADEGLLLLEHLAQNGGVERAKTSFSWGRVYAMVTDFPAGDYPSEGGRTGHVDEGWLADYRAYDGEFVTYPTSFREAGNVETAKEKVMMRFFSGEIDAEAFARSLDELIAPVGKRN